jgi:hypothetical protein
VSLNSMIVRGRVREAVEEKLGLYIGYVAVEGEIWEVCDI